MRRFIALLCAVTIGPGNLLLASQDAGARIPPDQLDSLVAPIALYPDPLLAQTLAASTYPLEVLQLQQWLARNPGLNDKALADAVAQQPWDPAVQAMAPLPDVVKRLADDVQWTTDLGNAFLAQQSDVMDAIQRMRQKAQQNNQLQSNPEVRVETQVVENRSVIVVEPASPEVVYVPSYNPTVVYGAPVYPYPPIYYPPVGAYAAGMAISWGVGVAMGAAWGGGWGWNTGWRGNNLTINNNNFYNRNANVRAGNTARATGTWQHNAAHRGGAPYSNRATANKFGGTARGESLANRQAGARQQINRQGGMTRQNATGTTGLRGGTGGAARPNAGTGGLRGGTGGAARPNATGTTGLRGGTQATRPGQRPGSSAVGNRPSGSFSGGRTPSGADRIGSRDLSRSSGGNTNAFGGGSPRYNGSGARASSSRGGSSLQSRSGGGFSGGSRSRSGGGFGGGGGSRGGGGRRGGGGGGRRR